jgi:hypothetical protein
MCTGSHRSRPHDHRSITLHDGLIGVTREKIVLFEMVEKVNGGLYDCMVMRKPDPI